MNGIEKKQLQIDRGTRVLIENIDDLRCRYGFSSIQTLTPIVETRLRSGLIPLKPFIFNYPIPSTALTIQMTVPITYPNEKPLFTILDERGIDYKGLIDRLIAETSSLNSLSSVLAHILSTVPSIDPSPNPASVNLKVGWNDKAEIVKDVEDAPFDLQSVRFFTCRSCRCCLADSLQLNYHSLNGSNGCTSLFLDEAPNFMKFSKEFGEQGKLACPKCAAKIGNWSWVGTKCSCNEWIAPSYQLIKSKIDVKRCSE